MRDPLEGLSATGTIRTGAALQRVPAAFRLIHDAAVAEIREIHATASVYAYGSVVTGQAMVGVSDVDLLTIGLPSQEASRIGAELSLRFAEICRGVEIGAAATSDFVGETDESYGNRVFLRHYCLRLVGSDVALPQVDYLGDRRAARGFNGDIAQHAHRWRRSLDDGVEPLGSLARRMSRKSLLAVAGLVSVHDGTWTTDRETSAQRWGKIVPEANAGLAQLLAWTATTRTPSHDKAQHVLDHTINSIVSAFRELIGLWPNVTTDK